MIRSLPLSVLTRTLHAWVTKRKNILSAPFMGLSLRLPPGYRLKPKQEKPPEGGYINHWFHFPRRERLAREKIFSALIQLGPYPCHSFHALPSRRPLPHATGWRLAYRSSASVSPDASRAPSHLLAASAQSQSGRPAAVSKLRPIRFRLTA